MQLMWVVLVCQNRATPDTLSLRLNGYYKFNESSLAQKSELQVKLVKIYFTFFICSFKFLICLEKGLGHSLSSDLFVPRTYEISCISKWFTKYQDIGNNMSNFWRLQNTKTCIARVSILVLYRIIYQYFKETPFFLQKKINILSNRYYQFWFVFLVTKATFIFHTRNYFESHIFTADSYHATSSHFPSYTSKISSSYQSRHAKKEYPTKLILHPSNL